MEPSKEMQERIERMLVAMDQKPINQLQANHMTVVLLTEIATRLEKIERSMRSHHTDDSAESIGGSAG